MPSTEAILDEVRSLYEEGQYLNALQAGSELGSIHQWDGLAGRLLAGRLATRLGAPRLGGALWYLAWRMDRSDLNARFFYVRWKLRCGRLLAAWNLLTSQEESQPKDGSPVPLSHWHLLHAEALSRFRDFQRANEWIRRAEALAPDDPWLWCVRAWVLAGEDLPHDALAAAEHALELAPRHVPAVQITADYLMDFNKDDEAIALLSKASTELQSGDLLLQLGNSYSELGEYEQALDCYRKVESHFPLMEPGMAQMLAARCSDAAYYCGQMDEALQYAEQAQTPFHLAILPKLRSGAERKRVILPVTFVKQHYLTCAPATLAAISSYWSMPAEHLEIAEEICYDGTPDASQRRWAESNGFVVRECRLDWDTCVALIDRRVPVLLGTTAPEGGHMQAVIGYDTCRRTLIIRDPSHREHSEFLAEGLFEGLQSTGPRATIIVPADQSALLDGITLSESELYDKCFELDSALMAHNRYRAQAVMDDLRKAAPAHRLTLHAQCAVCRYDADPIGLARCIDELLDRFPADLTLVMCKLGCLQEIGRLDDRLDLLNHCWQSGYGHPMVLLNYAREVSSDARHADNAIHILRKVIRYCPQNGQAYSALADLLCSQQRYEDGIQLYRFAACLCDTHEPAATTYFQAARVVKQTDDAIELLKDRFARLGQQSCLPACTLSWAYRELARDTEAADVLEAAERLRPDDPELLIFVAAEQARGGNYEKARELLLGAKPNAAKARWLRAAAHLAAQEGETAAALARWQEVVELEPLAADAHQMITQLLVDAEGLDAAIHHLRVVSRRHPCSFALRSLLLEWVKYESPAAVEDIAREILDFQPMAWHARCALALALMFQGQTVEAHREMQAAATLHASNPEVCTTWGRLHQAIGQIAAAKEAFRDAIRLSADALDAIHYLLEVCESPDERRGELFFVYEEFVKQTVLGDGLLVFSDYARKSLEPPAVLEVLREANVARPDLWHAWSALVRQLIAMERSAEALQTAEKACQRFPLRAQSWVDLALAHSATGNRDEKVKNLKRAIQLDRGCEFAACELARELRADGECDVAKRVVLDAIGRSPQNGRAHRELAELTMQAGDRAEAQNRLVKALRACPDDDSAWELLVKWGPESEDPRWALDLARDLRPSAGAELTSALVQMYPDEPKWRFEQSRFLFGTGDVEASIAVLTEAIRLGPDNPDCHDALATCLASMGRYDEAIAACRPAVFGDCPPPILRFRSADILAHNGDWKSAEFEMERVVRKDPDLLPAWLRLAEWFSNRPEDELYLQAARNYARLAPDDTNAWMHLGHAESTRRRLAEAVKAYSRAIELAPGNSFAGMSLFDLHLAAGDTAAASQVFERVSPYLRYVDIVCARIRLSVAEGDQKAAGEHFRELCRLSTADPQHFMSITESFAAAGWQREHMELVEDVIQQGRHMPIVGQLWIHLAAQEGRWRECAQKLTEWQNNEQLWACAALHFVACLSEAKEHRLLRGFIGRHRDRLRQDNSCWAEVGAAYARRGKFQQALEWMADWKSRDVEPHMLDCLAVCLAELGQDEKAACVRKAALQLPADETSPQHALSVAMEEILAGNLTHASMHVSEIDPRAFAGIEFYQLLLAMVRALLPDENLPIATSSAEYDLRIVRNRLCQVSAKYPAMMKSPVLRRQYFRALRWLAQQANQPLRAAWYSLRLKFK